MKKIIVHATGCSLVDEIYNGVKFSSQFFSPFLSQKPGDGGIVPGGLVLSDDLETFSSKPVDLIVKELTGDIVPSLNIGGPAMVALITAAQLQYMSDHSFAFYQNRGNDERSGYLVETLEEVAPLIAIDNYNEIECETSSTIVLNDPSYNNGTGERRFIHNIASSEKYHVSDIPKSFFSADITLFGATALTPDLHNNLDYLLKQSKSAGALTIVTTVFDFIHEKSDSKNPWPLGNGPMTYPLIDLLVCDHYEALRLSGQEKSTLAVEQFREWGLPSLVITNGAEPVFFYADAQSCFEEIKSEMMDVVGNLEVIAEKLSLKLADTTGCGDNFAGGILSSLIDQLANGYTLFQLDAAVKTAIVCGAAACFHNGGVMHEKYSGHKAELIDAIIGMRYN